MGPGVHIRYAASDKKRQTIPWVEYSNGGATQTYLADGTKPDAARALPIFEMQCVDCHNRAGHAFELPDHAVDHAMAHRPDFRDVALRQENRDRAAEGRLHER